MNGDDLLHALAVLMSLESPRTAHAAAAMLPEHVSIVDVLRAADGVQQLARALDLQRRAAA